MELESSSHRYEPQAEFERQLVSKLGRCHIAARGYVQGRIHAEPSNLDLEVAEQCRGIRSEGERRIK